MTIDAPIPLTSDQQAGAPAAFEPLQGPELVFAVVGAAGTDLTLVCEIIAEELKAVSYLNPEHVRLSELLRSFEPFRKIPHAPADKRIEELMNAGDRLRKDLERGDAMALLGIAAIREKRANISGSQRIPAQRQAYILHSLKHPEEVKTLRQVYGRAFYLIAAFSSRKKRVSDLSGRIAKSHYDFDEDKYRALAESLIKRDEVDASKDFGQNVQDTFPLADVFIDANSRESIQQEISRFIEILFGYPFHTPTPDEFGMFHARGAALRSADLSRQVGAIITTEPGEIVAVGCNEVPKPQGGAYWPGDLDDARDFKLGYDSSARIKRDIVAEIFHILKERNWLSDEKNSAEIEILVENALAGGESAVMKSAQIMNILEFGRIVHAEMSALMGAARRGMSVRGATLFCTTFPCHICARHIVSAGVTRVVYIEPYPKSMAHKLYPEAITVDGHTGASTSVVFEPFFGIAPRQYISLFEMPSKRKDKSGNVIRWKKSSADPRLERMVGSYLDIEIMAVGALERGLERSKINTV